MNFESSTSETTSSTPLYQLPQEILLLILHYLQPIQLTTTFPPISSIPTSYTELCHSWTSCNPPPWPNPPVSRALATFVKVSKRSQEVATPLLYNSIALHTIDSTNQLAIHLLRRSNKGPFIKHLYLPHDGLMHSPSDRLGGIDTWAASWREILRSASRLESLFLVTRPGGEALQEFLQHASVFKAGLGSLQRLTISSLSFSFPNLGVGSLHAPCLSHLHLIQWTPPTLRERFGTRIHQTLQILRLSRISSATLLQPVELGIKSQGSSAQHILDQSILAAPQPLLLLLRECIEQYTNLQVIILEVEQLADLEIPQGLRPWDVSMEQQQSTSSIASLLPSIISSQGTTTTGGFGAPFDQFALGQQGQLASLDFPADVPLSIVESEEWAQRLEDDRCRKRLQHWSRLRQCKDLLSRYSSEMRQNSSSNVEPIQFRIVAPRPLGWDRNESLIDFYANVSACRGEADFSAFQDEDVFDLMQKYPHLGHDFGCDQAGRKTAYWTGVLPPPPGLTMMETSQQQEG